MPPSTDTSHQVPDDKAAAPAKTAGLTTADAEQRLANDGENAIQEHRVNPWRKFLPYFRGPIPWMIEAAAVLSGAVRRWEDFAVIMVMLLLNACVGFFEEHKANHATEALKRRLALDARVLRGGTWQDLEARLLVPADVVTIKLGDIVPADVDLPEGDYLRVDQSALTGESLPVDKKSGDSAYSGSIVRQGTMRAAVTATGMNSYFGKTAKLVETAEQRSHFQQAVLKIGNFPILMTVSLIALLLVMALLRGHHLVDMLRFALILTVAAIPVALPAVLSVTMAVGVSKLAALKAIVSRLVSIEEMVGLDVPCPDKTGTLTRNERTLGDPVVVGDRPQVLLLVDKVARVWLYRGMRQGMSMHARHLARVHGALHATRYAPTLAVQRALRQAIRTQPASVEPTPRERTPHA